MLLILRNSEHLHTEADAVRSMGMPRVNDGALLFLQTMLAKMAPPEEGGSRIAIIGSQVR